MKSMCLIFQYNKPTKKRGGNLKAYFHQTQQCGNTELRKFYTGKFRLSQYSLKRIELKTL